MWIKFLTGEGPPESSDDNLHAQLAHDIVSVSICLFSSDASLSCAA